jgi:hypothetical protein
MAAVFPASLPWFTRFVLSPAGQRAATQPPKHYAARSNTASGWAKAEVSWVFFEAHRATFEDWFREDLNRGAAWALMKLPITPGGIAGDCYSAVRFPNGYSKTLAINGLWRVSAQIEIRDRFECAVPSNQPMVWSESASDPLYDITGRVALLDENNANPYPARHLFANRSASIFRPSYFEIEVADTSSSAVEPFYFGFYSGTRLFAVSYSGTMLAKVGLAVVDDPAETTRFSGANGYVGVPFDFSLGGVLQLAINTDGSVYVGVNNTYFGANATTGVLPAITDWSGRVKPYAACFANFQDTTFTLRTAAADLLYSPPTGYFPLTL